MKRVFSVENKECIVTKSNKSTGKEAQLYAFFG